MHTFDTSPFARLRQSRWRNRELPVLTRISSSLSLGVPPEVPPVTRKHNWQAWRARDAGTWHGRTSRPAAPWHNVGQAPAISAGRSAFSKASSRTVSRASVCVHASTLDLASDQFAVGGEQASRSMAPELRARRPPAVPDRNCAAFTLEHVDYLARLCFPRAARRHLSPQIGRA